MATTVCEACGKEYRVGEWPWCPHGFGNNLEEPLTPYWDENISTDGAEITSRGQRRQLMKQNGLEYRSKAKAPGKTLFFDMHKS